MRSPKMDDPEFREKLPVPKWPRLPRSALDLLFDFKNVVNAPAMILASVGYLGDTPQAVADALGEEACRLTKFQDRYTSAECGVLVERQDPNDIEALNKVVDHFNELVAARQVTRETLEPLIAQVTAVYEKYPKD